MLKLVIHRQSRGSGEGGKAGIPCVKLSYCCFPSPQHGEEAVYDELNDIGQVAWEWSGTRAMSSEALQNQTLERLPESASQLYKTECNSDLYGQDLKIKKSFRQLLICIPL